MAFEHQPAGRPDMGEVIGDVLTIRPDRPQVAEMTG
jgi:hypothetical protein